MSPTRETATQLDRAIDGLLRPMPTGEIAPAGELTATARLVRDALPRLHPRFGFEELLAARLSAAARSADPTVAAADVVTVVPFTTAASAPVVESDQRRRRGRVAGGAIASGVSLALPLAGAAIVMWRRSRSSGGVL